MDYLIAREIIALVLVMSCIGFTFYSSLKLSRDIKEESGKQRDALMEILKHSIDTIKSTRLEERVNAVALEGQHEVQLEMLKDAYEQERQMADKGLDPVYVQTTTGERIDKNTYELIA